MTRHPQEAITTFPDIPSKFGEDGGKFHQYYDNLAEELDDDLVKSVKPQLDGILIFAGLFTGVNSAFLALTLPEMTPNPADDSNALLLQLVIPESGTIASASDLPSVKFSPSPGIYRVNILFSISLTFAILSSFLAVLGQQWLVHYQKRSGGGPVHQRREQLRRYLGAKRWKLEAILSGVLPGLLQMGLLIFCISFILYLDTLNRRMSYIVSVPIGLALAMVFLMAISAVWDRWSPFTGPLAQLLHQVLWSCVISVVLAGVFYSYSAVISFLSIQHGFKDFLERCGISTDSTTSTSGNQTLTHRNSLEEDIEWTEIRRKEQVESVMAWVETHVRRPAECPVLLDAVAVRRVICTSQDPIALTYAAVNLLAIKDKEGLHWLLTDGEFHSRLTSLYRAALDRNDRTAMVTIELRAFSSSFLHLSLSVGSVPDFLPKSDRPLFPDTATENDRSALLTTMLVDETFKLIQAFYTVDDETAGPACKDIAELSLCAKLIEAAVRRDSHPSRISVAFFKIEELLLQEKLSMRGLALVSCTITFAEQFGRPPIPFRKRIDLVRNLMQLYRETNEEVLGRIVADAIATSGKAEWFDRPSYTIYVALLGHVTRIHIEAGPRHLFSGSSVCGVGTLLGAIESAIRHPFASSRDIELGKSNRANCVHALTNVFSAFESETRGNDQVWCDSLASLQEFFEWVKVIIEGDPKNGENAPLLDAVRPLVDVLPRRGSAIRTIFTSIEQFIRADQCGQDYSGPRTSDGPTYAAAKGIESSPPLRYSP